MVQIEAEQFLNLARQYPVMDVRSPAEFESGHIPGAKNLPLFENEERSIVGILYKNKGRQEAIRKGLEIVGPKMTDMVDRAIEQAHSGKVLVHCWRGGMRSSSVAWLFESAGLEVYVLEGGYKSYRKHIRHHILKNHRLLVLGGMTGSGKTKILQALAAQGEPVVDLEGLANHRGSAFGGVGLYGQPSTEHFENLLYHQITGLKPKQLVWVEDESRRVGEVFLPELFHIELRKSPVVAIRVSDDERVQVILEEYAKQPDEELLASIDLLQKRLGGLLAGQAKALIQDQQYEQVVRLLLPYYDKLYQYGLNKRKTTQVQDVDLTELSQDERISKLSDIRQSMQKEIFHLK